MDKKQFKAKYYCELCKKQMQDKNGMVCHQQSESHKLHMRMFAENPEQHIADNSDAFEENFINILRLRSDNQFYTVNSINNEIVRDKKAVRINSTRWPQIADFLKDIEAKGIVEILENESAGPMIKILTKSSKNTKKAKVVDEKEREKEEQTKRYLEMEQRIKQAEEKRIQSVHLRGPENHTDPETPSELVPNQDKISLSLAIDTQPQQQQRDNVFAGLSKRGLPSTTATAGMPHKTRVEALKDRLFQSIGHPLESRVELADRGKDDQPAIEKWLCKNLVVQIMDSDIAGGMYYKKKAKVRRVDEDLWAEIQELDSRDIIRIHQLHLRCVVPKVGRDVIVVKPGELRKRTGVLIEYDTATNVGKIEVLEPVTNAKTTHMLKFGDFSKKHN